MTAEISTITPNSRNKDTQGWNLAKSAAASTQEGSLGLGKALIASFIAWAIMSLTSELSNCICWLISLSMGSNYTLERRVRKGNLEKEKADLVPASL